VIRSSLLRLNKATFPGVNGNFCYEINLTKSTVSANHRPHCDKLMVSPQKVAFETLKKDADTVKYRFATVHHTVNLTKSTVEP
jgi:hypothetical protein